MIIAIDIGGSKTRWAAVTWDGARFDFLSRAEGPTSEIESLLHELECFTRCVAPAEAVCVGIAGPVVGDSARTTNGAVRVSRDELGRRLGCTAVFLLNDLEAQAYGLLPLDLRHLERVKDGLSDGGNRALIAAGTGLGESVLVERAEGVFVVPSEAGHADFSPSSEEEMELLRFLKARYEHVSWERALSGAFGFRNLYDFVTSRKGAPLSSALAARVEGRSHVGPILCDAAKNGDDVALRVVRLFLRLYGAEAGNLALRASATGGVYLAGGIATALLPWFPGSEFGAAFTNKGRLSTLVERVPVFVVTSQELPLLGAAEYARRRIDQRCRERFFAQASSIRESAV